MRVLYHKNRNYGSAPAIYVHFTTRTEKIEPPVTVGRSCGIIASRLLNHSGNLEHELSCLEDQAQKGNEKQHCGESVSLLFFFIRKLSFVFRHRTHLPKREDLNSPAPLLLSLKARQGDYIIQPAQKKIEPPVTVGGCYLPNAILQFTRRDAT